MPGFQTPRGTRDFLPEEMAARQFIMDTARKVFESYGFGQVDTPAFESWELLSAKGGGGEAIKNEIYYFRDKSDRELGLRFDLTVPFGRLVASNPQLPKPFRRYQISKVWRYDKPQAGRMREFTQMDADIAGAAGMGADSECISAAVRVLRALGFKRFEVRLNDRKVLNGLVQYVGIPDDAAPAVFRILDKLEKVPRQEISQGLMDAGVDETMAKKLLNLVEMRGAPKAVLSKASILLKGIPVAEEGIRELEEICMLSKPYDFDKYVVVDLSLVRGLDYYTGPIYEISAGAGKSIGSIAGGGRYDRLIELYGGKTMPATGISIGVERVCEVVRSEGIQLPLRKAVAVSIISVNDSVRQKAAAVAEELRCNGIGAEVDLMGRDLRKQMESAGVRGIPYAIIIGPKEVESGRYKLRDMGTGKEEELTLDGIIRKLK